MCGSESLRLDESTRTVEIEGVATEVPFRIHWCESCGSEMALSKDLRSNARAMRQVNKKHYGLLTGEEVRKIRKQLGLSQEQAAQLFGGGPVAFSKYENDEITQSNAMDSLLRLVSTCPELLQTLGTSGTRGAEGGIRAEVKIGGLVFDENTLAQAKIIFDETSLALKGFDNIYTASNDDIYDLAEPPRAAKWSTA